MVTMTMASTKTTTTTTTFGRPSMKQVLIAAGCLTGALLCFITQSTISSHDPHRRRLDISFHMSQATERNVDPHYLYDTSKEQFMSSPCRPESDGYFGSTSGTPMEIQFGFELETEDEENVDYLLEEVQEQVIDVVLSTSFPNLCGFRRRQERARHLSMRGLTSSSQEAQLKAKPRTTGFKFGMDLNEREDVCAPTVDPTNLCGVYKNAIGIYGRNLAGVGEHLIGQIKETLNGEQERLAKDGMVRLTTLDSLTLQTGVYTTPPTGIQALSLGAKAGMAVVIIALLAGAATFAVYIYLDRKQQRQEQRFYSQRGDSSQKQQPYSSNSTVGCEEASHVSEKVGLRDGTAVVLEGGRPVVIEFDQPGGGSRRSGSRARDPIEEERSNCGSTIYSHQSAGSKSSSSSSSSHHSYVPNALRDAGAADECKEPEDEHNIMGDATIPADDVKPADPMSQSIVSVSDYTERTATSNHRFT